MQFRIMTLNLEQDHKRWPVRRRLILYEIGQRKPDLMALNEVCIPLQTGRDLCQAAAILTETDYKLVQQTRVNGLATIEGEALLTRFDVLLASGRISVSREYLSSPDSNIGAGENG